MAAYPFVVTFAARALELELEAADATERRVIAGIAVPWATVGRTSMGPVRFERGALELANAPLLRDHDHTRTTGVVYATEDTPEGLRVRARVSRTPLGDETLTLAEDGALTGFSVGASPTEYHYETDADHGEVMVITAALGRELSVLPFPAFDSARVDHVAATAPDPDTERTTVPDTALELEASALPAVVPTAPVTPFIAARPRLPHLTAGDVAHLMILAGGPNPQRGAAELLAAVLEAEPPDRGTLLAALSPTDTTSAVGIVPPSYTADLIGGLPVATPYASNLVRRTGLPATGMQIIRPMWTALPAGGWVAAENTEPPSSPATIGTKAVEVLTYATANIASLNLINRGAFGGFAESYYAQVGIDYLAKKEALAVSTAEAAATAVAATATTAAGVIGELVAGQVAAQTVAGEFRGLMPEYAAVAADVWAELAETPLLQGPAFSSGSIQWGNLTGSLSGLVVAMIPGLATGHIVVGARAACALYDEAEARLSALVVNTLHVELGVIANCAIDVEYPKALAKATVPAGGAAEAASSGRAHK